MGMSSPARNHTQDVSGVLEGLHRTIADLVPYAESLLSAVHTASPRSDQHYYRVYRRPAGGLCRVTQRPDGEWVIEALTITGMTGILARLDDWLTAGKNPGNPPRWLADDLLNWPGVSLPVLQGVATHPVLGPRGQMAVSAGYDAETGLWLTDRACIDVDAIPDGGIAIDWLQNWLQDIPWADPADQTTYLGMLLGPILRPWLLARGQA